ncbi:hypothetical protein [Caulobacter sp. RL271]|jgi:hypothetical protein|uniref:Uncharacterized protein n=1 Tax=Caulobacter segnis TaxID=88688 RepID=A0ABY4ZSP1_9CAUL|nr:hypothetical protein [Caulobacter segnis]USQ95394.1 hypothetical protein MZV50_23070 [Caulobacter segnis]
MTSQPPDEDIPFAVELRVAGDAPRVLGRGVTLTLAAAIFEAALTAYPGQRVVLNRGAEILRDSQATS